MTVGTADAYIRVSRRAGREGESFISPGVQRERIARWAQGAGVEIVRWWEEIDQSGAKLERPMFTALCLATLDPARGMLELVNAGICPPLRRRGAAVAELERTMALNPNFTDWRFAEVLVFAGHPARAIEAVERHMRSDPFYAPLAPLWLGCAHYMLKQYPQALPPLGESLSRAPNMAPAHARLAATHAQLGNVDKARAEAAESGSSDAPQALSRAAEMLSTLARTGEVSGSSTLATHVRDPRWADDFSARVSCLPVAIRRRSSRIASTLSAAYACPTAASSSRA